MPCVFVNPPYGTISVGLIVPLVWGSVLSLGCAMLVIWLVSWLTIRQTQLWTSKK